MAEDTIVVSIDDSQLEDVLARLELVSITGQEVTGIKGDLDQTLPSINRELRLILGQAPGLRILMADYFRILRIQRSVLIARKELKKAGEDITLRGMLLQPQMALTIIATLVLMLKTVIEYFDRMKRERLRYEEFLRRERGLSKKEFDYLRAASGSTKTGPGRGIADNHYWGNPE